MAREIPAGAHGEIAVVVGQEHTMAAFNPELPAALATPWMIAWMETAAFRAMQPYCDEGETTVGTAINIQHVASSRVGMQIKAEAWMESSDGRFYTLRVSAHNGEREIGRGTVGRAVVNLKKMKERFG